MNNGELPLAGTFRRANKEGGVKTANGVARIQSTESFLRKLGDVPHLITGVASAQTASMVNWWEQIKPGISDNYAITSERRYTA